MTMRLSKRYQKNNIDRFLIVIGNMFWERLSWVKE
jgi:hypothetical protein